MVDFPLLRWATQQTAEALARGRVLTAHRSVYLLIASREVPPTPPFSVQIMRGSDTIYHEHCYNSVEAALTMLRAWNTLNDKLDKMAPKPQRPWRRIML